MTSLLKPNKDQLLHISVLTTFLSLIPTAYAALLSNSLTLYADFLRCAVEHLSIVLAWILVRKMRSTGDHEFHFGFGKLERLSSLLVACAMLVTISVLFISAIVRFFEPRVIEDQMFGFILAVLSVGGNCFLWIKNANLSRDDNSPVLLSQVILFRAKTLASLIVVLSLGVTLLFPHTLLALYIDPAGSLCIALYLVPSLKGLFEESVPDLIDRALEESYQLLIVKTLVEYESEYEHLREIRTRKSGVKSYIYIHLEFKGDQPTEKTIDTARRLRKHIEEQIPASEVQIVLC